MAATFRRQITKISIHHPPIGPREPAIASSKTSKSQVCRFSEEFSKCNAYQKQPSFGWTVQPWGFQKFRIRWVQRIDINKTTLPETNIAPENGPSQKETSILTIHFQVLC